MQTARRVCVRQKKRPAHMTLIHPALEYTASRNRSPENHPPTITLPEEAVHSPFKTHPNGSFVDFDWLKGYSINPTPTGSPVGVAATSLSDWAYSADWTLDTGAICLPSDPPQQPTGRTDCNLWFYEDTTSSPFAKLDGEQYCPVWDIKRGGTVVGDNFPAWLQREEGEYHDVLWLSPDSSAYFAKTVRPALEQRVLVFLSEPLGCVGTDTRLPLGQCTTTRRGGKRHYPQVTVKCTAFLHLETTAIRKAMRNAFYIVITVNPPTIDLLNHALQAKGTVIGKIPDKVQLAYRNTVNKSYETKHKRASPSGPMKGFLEIIKHGYDDVIGLAIDAAIASCKETGAFSSGADLCGEAVPAGNSSFRVVGSTEYKLAHSAFKKAFPEFFQLAFEDFIATGQLPTPPANCQLK